MSKFDQFNEIFTENAEFFKDLFERYAGSLDNVSFVKDSSGGFAEFEEEADNGYTLYYSINNDGSALITSCKLVRQASWYQPEEYEEKEYFYDDGIDGLEDFLEKTSKWFYY